MRQYGTGALPGQDILNPGVHMSLSHLSSALLDSQSLPVSSAMRIKSLGPIAAARPLPFKLSPIEPRKPVSLIKKNVFASMYATANNP